MRSTYPSFGSEKIIRFTGKSISHIDHNAFAGVNSVQSIDLSNNAITVISQAFNPYNYYLLIGTNLCYKPAIEVGSHSCYPGGHFNNLLTINLSNNKITHIDIDSMLGTVCETLDLSYNSLNKLVYDQLFSVVGPVNPVAKLKTLNLSNNQLTDISGLFPWSSAYYSRLTHIKLSFNKLTQITSTLFSNVKSLTHLYLNNNLITSIHKESFAGLVNLREIHIYSNSYYDLAATNPMQMIAILQLCSPTSSSLCGVCTSSSCAKFLEYPYSSGETFRIN